MSVFLSSTLIRSAVTRFVEVPTYYLIKCVNSLKGISNPESLYCFLYSTVVYKNRQTYLGEFCMSIQNQPDEEPNKPNLIYIYRNLSLTVTNGNIKSINAPPIKYADLIELYLINYGSSNPQQVVYPCSG